MSHEHFTLEEARALVGKTVVVRRDFPTLEEPLKAGDTGTVVGVTGERTARGEVRALLTVQFWLTDPDALPWIFTVSKDMYHRLFTQGLWV